MKKTYKIEVDVTATAYNTKVQHEKIMSDLRGFDSVFDSLLFSQKVSRDLYNRQIDVIMEKLAPHMRKYARLIKKLHKLDKMTYADLKLPIDPEYSPNVTIEESKKYIEEGYIEDFGLDRTVDNLLNLANLEDKSAYLMLQYWFETGRLKKFEPIEGIDAKYLQDKLKMKKPAVILAYGMLLVDPKNNAIFLKRQENKKNTFNLKK